MDHDCPSCTAGRKAIRPTVFDTLKAYIGLITIDLLIKLGGFPLLYRTIKRRTVSEINPAAPWEIERICAAADKAGRYYFKHALCLQRSALIAFLLRRRGIPATMVIGCRIMPYQGHAWVEVEGRVVSDKPEVQQFYQVLERV